MNSFCFIIVTFLFKFNVVVQSDNAPTCSTQSTLIPYRSHCSNSSQCITGYCSGVCICPDNLYFHNVVAYCVLNCNATANNSFGQIVSHNYPSQYPNNDSCMWNFIGIRNSYYVISITYMDIESCSNCGCDSLKIYDVTSLGNIQLAMFCNRSDSTTKIVASSSSYMQIVFKTNGYVRGGGFSLSYQRLAYEATITEPRYGYIVSPGYPLKYPASSYFSWTIVGRTGSFISFRLLIVWIESSDRCHDPISIFDGNNTKNRFVTRLCSNNNSQPIFMSTGNYLHVVFTTDSSYQYQGFLARYEIIDVPVETVCNSSKSCIQRPVCLYDSCVCPDNYYYSKPSNTCSEALGELRICEPQVRNMCSRKSDFVCQPDQMGVKRCLCPSGSFNNGTRCLPYSNLSFVLTRSPDILNRNVTFHLTTGSTTQPVSYQVAWLATDDSNDFGELDANPSGLLVQGLTPGTEYNFTVLAIIQGLGYYNDTTLSINFTLETLPARPGELNESSSNLLNSPYVLRFGPSEGRVSRYVISVGARSYDVLTPELTIKDLTPDTRYNYTITAYNKGGHGSDDVIGSFKTEPVKKEEAALNIFLIAGVTVASVVIICVTVCVTLLVRKRRNSHQTPAGKQLRDRDHQEVVTCSSSTAPTKSANTVVNTYISMNIADLHNNINTVENDENDYDFVMESPIDLYQEEMYETLNPIKEVVQQNVSNVEKVYLNLSRAASQE